MLRIINCIDNEGNHYQIKGLRNESISEFEILVPMNYRIIYGGVEWYGANHNGVDIERSILDDADFAHMITIVNLNPKPIQYKNFDGEDNDKDIELFKYLTANCSIINIILDKNNKLVNTVIRYETNDTDRIDPLYNDEEIASIFDEDFPEDYFARYRY